MRWCKLHGSNYYEPNRVQLTHTNNIQYAQHFKCKYSTTTKMRN